jgi:hypothetical protein
MPRAPKDLADRMAARRRQAKADDGYERETFTSLETKLVRRRGRCRRPLTRAAKYGLDFVSARSP